MEVKFWGVRGSLATPLTNRELHNKLEAALKLSVEAGLNAEWQVSEFITQLPWHVKYTAGGDTTCIEVNAGDTLLILDAGTGFRPLGIDLIRRYSGKPIKAHVLMSHTHWDHICGIPFFVPAFIADNEIKFYGAHENLGDRLRHQQDFEYFPVPMDIMGGIKEFVQLELNSNFMINDVEITTQALNHPGGCTGYRITYQGKTMVFATDSEYKNLSAENLKPIIEFFRDADLLIFDAQYSLLESAEKEDWGHSNAMTGIDMAFEANVKRLILTHHEPAYDDKKLCEIFQSAEEYLHLHPEADKLEMELAREGNTIIL
ncbi:MAG: MBL fold metallo-hydrolase [Calditrichaeota bacterium]|nr:MBL fold metallo-hydrolase [Calditrichota bacterium]